MSTPAGLGEAPRRDPRRHLTGETDRTLHEQDAARELDESLDTPVDPKARQEAVLALLISIADYVPARHSQEIREALGKAYDAGVEDGLWPATHNPMDGAIDRLKGGEHDPNEHAEVSWALNEAFRNGMESEQQSMQTREPEVITVHVPGIPFESEDGQVGSCDWIATPVKTRDPHTKTPAYALPERFWDVAYSVVAPKVDPPNGAWVVIRGLAQHNVSGGVAARDWFARRRLNEMVQSPSGGTYPVYEVQGDPNSMAVGRFKAQARKFFGVD